MDGYQLALNAAVMLQDKLLLDAVTQQNDEQDPHVQKLQSAVRDAVAELARDFPVLQKCTGCAVDGVIPYPSGEADGIDIHRVTRGERSVPFTVDSLGIHVPSDGTYTVQYSASACDWQAYDDISAPNCVSMQMTAHLVARNYCIMCGRMDEADIFDSRYEQSAQALRLKRRAKLPSRKFK